jgi:hypothetical protein
MSDRLIAGTPDGPRIEETRDFGVGISTKIATYETVGDKARNNYGDTPQNYSPVPPTLGREGNDPLCLGGISCAYDVVCHTIPLTLSPTF